MIVSCDNKSFLGELKVCESGVKYEQDNKSFSGDGVWDEFEFLWQMERYEIPKVWNMKREAELRLK